MSTRTAFILGVFLWTSAIISGQRLLIESELGNFSGTLERYTHTKNDLVFLLGESGSIGAHRFPQVKLFAKLIAQRFSVSAEESRAAVVTFSTGSRTPIDYIKNSHGKNMCTLLKEIDAIEYSGGGTETDEAMKAAEGILAVARPDSEKIIVLLTDRKSDSGHSPVALSDSLKRRGITIFAIGVADLNVREINSVASSPRHIYILPGFDYISKVNLYLIEDAREGPMEFVADGSGCNGLCAENSDCCEANAQCYCGTRTEGMAVRATQDIKGEGTFKDIVISVQKARINQNLATRSVLLARLIRLRRTKEARVFWTARAKRDTTESDKLVSESWFTEVPGLKLLP